MPNNNFSADISEWVKKTGQRADAFCRIFCSEMAERVVMDTPVDTGFCRSQWQPSLNGAMIGNAATVTMAASQVKAGDTFALTNNCAYVRKLEWGWSQQQPNGWVRRAVSDAPNIANRVLARVQQMD